MAFITVLQLKNAVASIPAGANGWEIEVPDDQPMTVLNNRTTDAAGGRLWTTKGYVDMAKLTWTAVP